MGNAQIPRICDRPAKHRRPTCRFYLGSHFSQNIAPIIIETTRVGKFHRLVGAELGVDDHLCYPFSLREPVTQIKSILRRIAPDSDLIRSVYGDARRNPIKKTIGCITTHATLRIR